MGGSFDSSRCTLPMLIPKKDTQKPRNSVRREHQATCVRAHQPTNRLLRLVDSLQMTKTTIARITLVAFAALLPLCRPQDTETRPQNSSSAAQRSTSPTGARLCTESDMLQPIGKFSPTIIYLMTSPEPVSAKEFLTDDSVALLAFSDPIPQDADCPCCVWSLLGETQDKFFQAGKKVLSSISLVSHRRTLGAAF